MSTVLLTKRIEFAAAHRYIKADWDEAKHRPVLGLIPVNLDIAMRRRKLDTFCQYDF